MNKLGWDVKPADTPEERQLRSLLASALARAGDAGAIAQANSGLQRYLKDPAGVDVSMLDFVIGTAGRNADAATYEQMLERTLQTQNTEERGRFGRAVLTAKDPALAARSLKLALSDALPAAMTSGVVPLVSYAGHSDLAWTFAVANREALLKDQESGGKNRLFPGIVSGSTVPAEADKMEAYVKQTFGPDAQVEAARAANGVRTRAKQKQALLPQVRAALK
jgi:aminopeptidase N